MKKRAGNIITSSQVLLAPAIKLMEYSQPIVWLLLICTGITNVIVAWKIAVRNPAQWKTLFVLMSFTLVCYGVLPASKWFAALPLFKGSKATDSLAGAHKLSGAHAGSTDVKNNAMDHK